MISRADKLLGRLVLDRGLATAEQVARCVEIEKRRGGKSGALADILCEQGLITKAELSELLAACETALARQPDQPAPSERLDRPAGENGGNGGADVAPDRAAVAFAPPSGGDGRTASRDGKRSGRRPRIERPPSPEAPSPAPSFGDDPFDSLLAEISVVGGVIPLVTVRECLQAQADLAEVGRRFPLGQILIKRRAIDVETFLKLKAEVEKRLAARTRPAHPSPAETAPSAAPRPESPPASSPSPRAPAPRSPSPPPPLTPPPPISGRLPLKGPKAPGVVAAAAGAAMAAAAVAADTASSPGKRGGRPGGLPSSGPSTPPFPSPPPAALAELGSLVGTRFGRYDIIAEIGRGGMGVVYRAHDRELDRIVALKVLKEGEAATEKQVRRFKRETEAAAKLRHPNIVPIHEVGCEGGRHFFTMDLIDGEPLDEVIRRGPVLVSKALEVAETVARAIDHANGEGIIHRDLKPANIILDREGRPRVMDFGLAKNIDHQSQMTRTGAAVGTPFYMPPEQARGDARRIDRRVDVYAIGVILYEMLTGRLPFEGDTTMEVYHRILTEDAVPPSAWSPEIDAEVDLVCLKAMAKVPGDRYSTALALAEDIARKREGAPVTARPPGRIVRGWRRLKRASPVAIGVTVAILIASSSLLVVYAIRKARSERQRTDAVASELRSFLEVCEKAPLAAAAAKAEAVRLLDERRAADAASRLHAAIRAAEDQEGWIQGLKYRPENEEKARRHLKEEVLPALAPGLRDLHVLRARTLTLARPGARREDVAEALAEADAALRIDPKCVDAWVEKGNLLSMRGDFHDAVQAFDKGLEAAPEAPVEEASPRSAALFGRAIAAEAAGRPSDASDDLGAVIDLERKAAERAGRSGAAALILPRGSDSRGAGATGAGGSGFGSGARATGLDEPSLLARALLARARLGAAHGDVARSAADLEDLSKSDSEAVLVPTRVLRSQVRLALGKLGEAFEDAEDVLADVPGRPDGHHARGLLHLAQGDIAKARADFEAARERDPKFGPALVALGAVLERLLDGPAAAKAYEGAMEARGGGTEVFAGLGGGGGAAASIAGAAATVETRAVRALGKLRLGEHYRALGDRDKAIYFLGQAVDLDPRLAIARIARARLEIEEGKLSEAADDLAAAERSAGSAREPAASGGHLARLPVGIVVGSGGISAAELRAAIEVARGHLALARGDSTDAASRFRSATELAPRYPEAFTGLGLALGRAPDPPPEMEAARSDAFLRALGLEKDADEVGPGAEAAVFYRIGREHQRRGAGGGGTAGSGGGALGTTDADQKAVTAFDQAARRAYGAYARAHYERARVRAKGNHVASLRKAIGDCDAAIAQNPFFVDAYLLRGELRLAVARGASGGAAGAGADAVASGDVAALLDLARKDFADASHASEDRRAEAWLGLAEVSYEAASRPGLPATAAKTELASALADLARAVAICAKLDEEARALRDEDPTKTDRLASTAELLARIYDRRAAVYAHPVVARPDLAEADARRAAEYRRAKQKEARDLVQRGRAALHADAAAEAVDLLVRATEADPTDGEAVWLLAEARRRHQGDLCAYALTIAKATELAPHYVDSFYVQLRAIDVDVSGVLAAVEAELAANPKDVEARVLRGAYHWLRFELGKAVAADADRGIADLDVALELSPRHVLALLLRAYLKQKRGLLDDALADCREAGAIAPNAGVIDSMSAAVLLARGDPDGAIRDLGRCLEKWRSLGIRGGAERIRTDPAFTGLRDDPRFRELVKDATSSGPGG